MEILIAILLFRAIKQLFFKSKEQVPENRIHSHIPEIKGNYVVLSNDTQRIIDEHHRIQSSPFSMKDTKDYKPLKDGTFIEKLAHFEKWVVGYQESDEKPKHKYNQDSPIGRSLKYHDFR